jgi:ArsR family transcriptional regulator, lead/cadmium/zinc/bismuth-responsive transcriptional repressor
MPKAAGPKAGPTKVGASTFGSRADPRALTPGAGPDEAVACAHDDHPRTVPKPTASGLVIEQAAALFRALGDSARLSLLARLAQGEYCVTELAEVSGEGLSTVSQRLRTLRAERLLRRRRVGKHVYYTLADEHVAMLIESALAHASE